MEFIEIIKKIITHPSEIYERLDNFSFNKLLVIFFLYIFFNAIIITVMPDNFGEEFSKRTLQLSEANFFYFFFHSLIFNFLILFLFSPLFIFFFSFLKSKIRIILSLFINFILIVSHYLYLKKIAILNWFFTSILIFLLISIIKKQKIALIYIYKITILLYLLEIIFFPIFIFFIKLNYQNLYSYAQILITLWIAVLFINFARKKFKIPIITAFFSIVLTSINSIFIFYIFKSAGIINEKTFKVILILMQ